MWSLELERELWTCCLLYIDSHTHTHFKQPAEKQGRHTHRLGQDNPHTNVSCVNERKNFFVRVKRERRRMFFGNFPGGFPGGMPGQGRRPQRPDEKPEVKDEYYTTLGVKRSATDKEIRSAYRKLARKASSGSSKRRCGVVQENQ